MLLTDLSREMEEIKKCSQTKDQVVICSTVNDEPITKEEFIKRLTEE